MAPFFSRRLFLYRPRSMGFRRRRMMRVMAMGVELARKRRALVRMREELADAEMEAALVEEQIRITRTTNALRYGVNTFCDLWVNQCLFEIEEELLMRNSFARRTNGDSIYDGGRRHRRSQEQP